jgi:HEPN domain-containing protein/stress-induced morphogen
MNEATVRSLPSVLDPELRRYIEVNWERILKVFNPRHIIAFGSRVNGTAKPDSDLDLIIVSDVFEGVPFLQRSRIFNEQVPWHLRVDAWCYTVMEFERKRREIGIVADACREGVWLLKGELLLDEEVNGVITPEEQAQQWIAQGESDLKKARLLYDNDAHDGAVMMAQQAAEKFLKALYIARQRATPPRTHDLENLATLLGAPVKILSLCKPLTEDFPKTRYPDVAGMPPFLYFDAATARERIEQAEQIREWVIEQIKTPQPDR